MGYYSNTLSPKERAFCEAYVESYNAVDAYLAAYDTNNISTAKANSYQVLKRQRVKDYISQLQKEAFERAMITPERVANKLADIAFAAKGDENYNATAQLKALDLLQKQMGLQTQKVDANVSTEINVNLVE